MRWLALLLLAGCVLPTWIEDNNGTVEVIPCSVVVYVDSLTFAVDSMVWTPPECANWFSLGGE